MKTNPNKELLLSLIKDDLINSKLVYGLNDLGMDSSAYFVNLSSTVFKLMGFENSLRSEALYEEYIALSKEAKHIDISESMRPLDELVLKIYRYFENKKQGLKLKTKSKNQ